MDGMKVINALKDFKAGKIDETEVFLKLLGEGCTLVEAQGLIDNAGRFGGTEEENNE